MQLFRHQGFLALVVGSVCLCQWLVDSSLCIVLAYFVYTVMHVLLQTTWRKGALYKKKQRKPSSHG